MAQMLEINEIERLAEFRREWGELLRQTAGASFFQSLEWLEVYWRHFGDGQRLRTMIVLDEGRPTGILPLVVRSEATKVGHLRVLTFPLHDWGSFYGPIGADPGLTLAAGLEHIHRAPRDWDILELRWQGAVGTDPTLVQRAMLAAGFQAYPTVWDRAALVDFAGTWQSYWAARKGAWLRRFRHAERRLAQQGEISHVRYRPLGELHDDGSPRWDLYDACEELARRSWQGGATDGTTLSHDAVRGFLREAHEAAAAAGAADLNLLLLDGMPAAFVYGYHYGGYVYGLRRGYDAAQPRGGGQRALGPRPPRRLRRGDRIYDMGVGSRESKRHFETRAVPDPALQPLSRAGVARRSAAGQALVAGSAAAGVHRGRPCSGWHGRRAMNLSWPVNVLARYQRRVPRAACQPVLRLIHALAGKRPVAPKPSTQHGRGATAVSAPSRARRCTGCRKDWRTSRSQPRAPTRPQVAVVVAGSGSTKPRASTRRCGIRPHRSTTLSAPQGQVIFSSLASFHSRRGNGPRHERGGRTAARVAGAVGRARGTVGDRWGRGLMAGRPAEQALHEPASSGAGQQGP